MRRRGEIISSHSLNEQRHTRPTQLEINQIMERDSQPVRVCDCQTFIYKFNLILSCFFYGVLPQKKNEKENEILFNTNKQAAITRYFNICHSWRKWKFLTQNYYYRYKIQNTLYYCRKRGRRGRVDFVCGSWRGSPRVNDKDKRNEIEFNYVKPQTKTSYLN